MSKVSKTAEKREVIVNWIEENYEIYQDGEECGGLETKKSGEQKACLASSAKGILKYITERGYTLKKDGKKQTLDMVEKECDKALEGKFEKKKTEVKALPEAGSIKAKVNWELDTSETDYMGTLGKVGKKMKKLYGDAEEVEELDEEIAEEDKWEREWRLEINGKAVSVYQLKEHAESGEWEVAVKKPISAEVRLWCLEMVEDEEFKKELEKWKRGREKAIEKSESAKSESSERSASSEKSEKKRVLKVEDLDLDDL